MCCCRRGTMTIAAAILPGSYGPGGLLVCLPILVRRAPADCPVHSAQLCCGATVVPQPAGSRVTPRGLGPAPTARASVPLRYVRLPTLTDAVQPSRC